MSQPTITIKIAEEGTLLNQKPEGVCTPSIRSFVNTKGYNEFIN